MNIRLYICCLLVSAMTLTGASLSGAQETKGEPNDSKQAPRTNLQDTDPEANDLCSRVIQSLEQKEVYGYCYINEVGEKGEHLEQFLVLSNAAQGQEFAAAAALSVMVTYMARNPQIDGKSFIRMRSQAGDVKLLLTVGEAMACVDRHTNVDSLSRCLLAHTQHH